MAGKRKMPGSRITFNRSPHNASGPLRESIMGIEAALIVIDASETTGQSPLGLRIESNHKKKIDVV